MSVTIGVLALQGAFSEHVTIFNSLPNVKSIEVRTAADIEGLDGIVLPGGESTAISLIGEKNGVFEKIKEWVEGGKPVWGTCAGCIMLANDVVGQKLGGQGLIGGMDISVHRNYFGRQIASFEQNINLNISNNNNNDDDNNGNHINNNHSSSTFPGVFIRAPAITGVKKEGVQILGEITIKRENEEKEEKEEREERIIVAAQQNNILATIFHPELTSNNLVHQYFVDLVKKNKQH